MARSLAQPLRGIEPFGVLAGNHTHAGPHASVEIAHKCHDLGWYAKAL